MPPDAFLRVKQQIAAAEAEAERGTGIAAFEVTIDPPASARQRIGALARKSLLTERNMFGMSAVASMASLMS